MRIGSLELNGQVALAPMAGVTDWAFRNICAQEGADWTVTEMVSSRALVYRDQKSAKLLRRSGGICGAQIFGNDPGMMAEAAQLALEISGCDFIDINMGCPMRKVASNGDGCGLMRTPALAGQIVRAVSDAVSIPVTVKCRTGWDKSSINVVPFAQQMQENGAAMIAVHGRTRGMLYSGVADWDIIRRVKEAVTIPVVANGDIVSGDHAIRCLNRSGADALMVGRGCFGDPWLFGEIQSALKGLPTPERPPLHQRVDTAVRQFTMACEDKGEHIACLEARKHFAWYLRGVSHSNYYKVQISAISSMEDIHRIAKGIQNDLK